MKNKCIYGLLVGAMMAGACPVWGETVVGETASPSDSIKLVVVSDNDALYYKVVKGATPIVEKSALGITTSVGDFSTGLSEPSFTERLVDDRIAYRRESAADMIIHIKRRRFHVIKTDIPYNLFFGCMTMAWLTAMRFSVAETFRFMPKIANVCR